MEPKGTFGPRLRQERERRHISLESIAANTKISLSLLQGLERDDVKRWPSGIFRRAFVRSYAQAIGMDPEAVVREFDERFPDPSDDIAVQKPAPAQPVDAGTVAALQQSPSNPRDFEIVLRLRLPRALAEWIRWAFGHWQNV